MARKVLVVVAILLITWLPAVASAGESGGVFDGESGSVSADPPAVNQRATNHETRGSSAEASLLGDARQEAQTGEGRLSGTVVDLSGAPVVGAEVRVRSTQGGSTQGDLAQQTLTDEQGRFAFEGLAAGEYRVVAADPRWVTAVATVDVSEPADEPLELRFRSLALTDEVTVSATHTAADVMRVPGEVSVIERDAFDKAQARSLDDVMRYVPGIEIGATRRLRQSPNIRGFDASRVLVTRDGARVSQFTSGHKGQLFLDVNDVERAEVVRGPASALYGSGALGGVLALTSPDAGDLLAPGQAIGASLSTSYSGAYDELMFSPRAYGATADGYGFVLGYSGRRTDGLVEVAGDVGQIDFAEEDVNDLDARFTAPVGSTGSLRLSYNEFRQDGRSSTSLDNVIVPVEEQVQRETRQQTLSATYDARGDDWWWQAVRVNGYYTGMDLDETRPSDGRQDTIEFRTWGFDVRNSVWAGDQQRFTYGVEAFRDEEDSLRDDEVNGLFPPGSQMHWGVYVQDEITLAGGRLVVVPGVRWDRWESSNDDPEVAERTSSRVNPKIGATLEVLPGFVLSSSYGEGFRAPNFQELYINGTHFRVPLGPGMTLLGLFTPNPELDPETSRNVDVGARFRRGGVSAGVAYYHAWADDFIETIVTEGFIPPGTVLLDFTARNVQEATLEGVEATFRWDLHPSWTLRANHYTPRGEDGTTGEPLGSIPPDKTVLGIEFREPRAGTVAGLNTRFVADYDRVPEGVTPQDSYTLLDLYTAWTPRALPDLTLRFNVDNLTDAAYRVPLLGIPGTGRDFRIGATVRFGR